MRRIPLRALPICHLPPVARKSLLTPYLKDLKRYPDWPKTLGEHLRKRRLNAGLLQKDVAKLLRVTTSSYRNWETFDHVPKPEVMSRIVKFLGRDPSDRSALPSGPSPDSVKARDISHPARN